MHLKVGIICAGDEEVAPFLEHIENKSIRETAMLKIYEGSINGVDIVTLYSGVCKVNAAIATQILIDRYGVNTVINAGTAGGMDPKLKIFDTAISTEVAYHDVAEDILTDFHPWMDTVFFPADSELLRLTRRALETHRPEHDVYFGRMVTSEAFITDDGRQAINDAFAPLTVDMETASIAHVCYVNRIPFIAIRCVTDTADHSGTGCFEENCPKASAIAKDITLALLDELRLAETD